MAATTEPGPVTFPVPPLAARLFDLARAQGYEARIVGGAVRDWLAGLPIGDIDMAVAARCLAQMFRQQLLAIVLAARFRAHRSLD